MSTCKPSDPAAVRKAHEGPLDCYIDLFVQRLREQQFSPESVRTQVLHVADLSRWLHARELSARQRAEEDFARYLAVERGLAPATLMNYVPFVSQLLTERFGRGPIRLSRTQSPGGSNRPVLSIPLPFCIGSSRKYFVVVTKHDAIICCSSICDVRLSLRLPRQSTLGQSPCTVVAADHTWASPAGPRRSCRL
jgi:hypothetical protein